MIKVNGTPPIIMTMTRPLEVLLACPVTLIYFHCEGPVQAVLNVEVFHKIFLRAFAEGTTDDVKTELLKTMRAIFALGANR